MKDRFFLYFSALLWLLMAIGFSDNWLFDVGQESNSQPKFLIHAFFSFSWFTLLVAQSGLVRTGNTAIHMRLGPVAMAAYICMTITIWYLFLESFLDRGDPTILIKPVELLSIVLVGTGFMNRRRNAGRHREYLVFGSFCLIGPALDRTAYHLFGPEQMNIPALIMYLVLFGMFVAATKKFRWYMVLWIIFMIYNLFPILVSGNS